MMTLSYEPRRLGLIIETRLESFKEDLGVQDEKEITQIGRPVKSYPTQDYDWNTLALQGR
jgi:hypothetical protein